MISYKSHSLWYLIKVKQSMISYKSQTVYDDDYRIFVAMNSTMV
jgi:hypothetical protein